MVSHQPKAYQRIQGSLGPIRDFTPKVPGVRFLRTGEGKSQSKSTSPWSAFDFAGLAIHFTPEEPYATGAVVTRTGDSN